MGSSKDIPEIRNANGRRNAGSCHDEHPVCASYLHSHAAALLAALSLTAQSSEACTRASRLMYGSSGMVDSHQASQLLALELDVCGRVKMLLLPNFANIFSVTELLSIAQRHLFRSLISDHAAASGAGQSSHHKF